MRHALLLAAALAASTNTAVASGSEFPAGYLYAASPAGIIEIDREGNEVRTIALGGEVRDVAFSARGTLYATVSDLDQVVEIDCDGTILDTLSHGNLVTPYGLAVGTWGELYVTGWVSDSVFVFDREGTFLKSMGSLTISGGAGLEVGPDGHLLACSSNSEQIKEYDASGTFLRNVTNTTIEAPRDLTTSPWGTTVVGTWSGEVQEIDEDGTILHATTGHSAPQAVAFGPDGLLYAANISYIQMFTLDETGFTDEGEFVSLSFGGGSITGLAFAPQRFTAVIKGQLLNDTGVLKINETAELSIGPGGFHTMLSPNPDGLLDPIMRDFVGSGPDVPHPVSTKKRRINAFMVPRNAATNGIVSLKLDLKGGLDDQLRYDAKGIKGTLNIFGNGGSIDARIQVRGKKAKLN